MLPFCTDTATLYHSTGDESWDTYVLKNVKWRGHSAHRASDGVYLSASDPMLIVPYDAQVRLSAQGRDYVVCGEGKPLNESYTPQDLMDDHACVWVIAEVEDLSAAPFLRHWKVTLK